MEAWNIYTRNSREVGHECITFIESDSYFPTSHVSTHLSPVEWRTNSKSRLANNSTLPRANESWIFARIAKFQLPSTSFHVIDVSPSTCHEDNEPNNREDPREFLRKNGLPQIKSFELWTRRVHSLSREKKFICTKLGAHLGVHRQTKLQLEEKREVGSRPFRVWCSRELYVERVCKNQMDNEVENCVNLKLQTHISS